MLTTLVTKIYTFTKATFTILKYLELSENE